MAITGPTMPRPCSRRAALALAAGAGAAVLLPAARAAAPRLFPADGEAAFIARRQGRAVGTRRFRFAHLPGRFTVRIDIDLDVRAGAAPLWRYVHHGEEVWRAGWLDSVVADTNDDGRRYRVRAGREAGILTGAVNGAAFTVSGYIIPASLWHRDTPASPALFDAVDGRIKVVRGTLMGNEDVPLGTATIAARHFSIIGEIVRDVWYDAECNLVRIAIPGRDGLPIVFDRQ